MVPGISSLMRPTVRPCRTHISPDLRAPMQEDRPMAHQAATSNCCAGLPDVPNSVVSAGKKLPAAPPTPRDAHSTAPSNGQSSRPAGFLDASPVPSGVVFARASLFFSTAGLPATSPGANATVAVAAAMVVAPGGGGRWSDIVGCSSAACGAEWRWCVASCF